MDKFASKILRRCCCENLNLNLFTQMYIILIALLYNDGKEVKNSYFKGYWMVTNRCNLRCSYCVLENAPDQLKAELNLEDKKKLVSHLYNNFGFRRLTLSGGEVIIFGKHPPNEFIELLRHIKTFKSSDPEKNLYIEMYTNASYLDERVIKEMKGVVDEVAVTIDGAQNEFLSTLGRKYRGKNTYFDNIAKACGMITKNNMLLKLHSVIGQKNHAQLADELSDIYNGVKGDGGLISKWKFFQYMSYDAPEKDKIHHISKDEFEVFVRQAQEVLKDTKVKLHFKDNTEMNDSLFNILSYGNAQYMRDGDSWSTSKRTNDLCSYKSMKELFEKHDINEKRFRKFHELIV